ncbi:hypothetical protein EZV62_007123 [Acer yangbiense]|uniref:F-box domain-containing protein n=1 Tax=Acer yangbiense TaxID=1000413 RepID=A0A5C7I9N8_9ROSI|nr:hypothetical protein EZV62_007123 [Acer yangbiense]
MSNWSDLPPEILNLIVERLYYNDQVRVREVCKSWRSNIYYDGKYADKLPWIIGYKGNTLTEINQFYLYEPSQKQRYRVKTKIPSAYAILHASKFGWLLFSEIAQVFSYSRTFFFYCPFINEIIRLPELDMNHGCQFQATFSTAPSSSDCVVFVFNSCSDPSRIRVSTCSPVDTAWSSLLFNGDYGLQIKKVAYAKGVFHCAFFPRFAYMGAYNPALQEWKIHPYPSFIIQRLHNHQNSDLDLIDSPDDENLLLSYYPSRERNHVYVFRFDQSQMKWFRIKNFMSVSSSCNGDHHERDEIKTLNNRVLFCSSVKSLSVPAEGEASRLANNIHWCSSEGCPQIYEWVDWRSDRGWSKDWIQPPHAHKFMTTGGSELEPDSDRSRTAVAGGSELEPGSDCSRTAVGIIAFLCFWIWVGVEYNQL